MHSERLGIKPLMFGILLATTLAGCSSRQAQQDIARPDSPYCLRSGNAESFSCDAAVPATTAAAATAPGRSGTIEDDALYAELAEIKSWLNSEKDEHADSNSNTDESDILLSPPVATAAPAEPAPAPPLPRLQADARYRLVLNDAQALYRQGFHQHAQTELMQLIELYPDRPEAYNNLGVMLAESRQYSDAIDQLQQALATHPHYARIHANLRNLYAELSKSTYSDALGLGRSRPAPRLDMLEAGLDADDASSITADVGQALEAWAKSPAMTLEQRAALYIPGFSPDGNIAHTEWLQSLATPTPALQLQAYELAVMTPDWVKVMLQAGPQPPAQGGTVKRELSLIRIDSRWLISKEQPVK
ncbi:tetratricopeptide repeat protein [Marinobacterium rhizophilum]|uniref:Tetratricopeptide repeat protein n=1 Tax=Marinobacterium rhizophilum TaxID=420402 RepID=A0ABY5HHR2_9GAMM|nr:tetratricopeptide repeat protein [Marinobacterium rhizophilum]UTW11830.1 tetratricopeptide repeat protein [Marinobacterium rhizophilum]